MKKNDYKRLEIYKRSLNIACEIIEICDDIRPFRLSDQIAGSSISIPSNICEGSTRKSIPDFKRFLEYASGSAAELETQLIIYKRTKNAKIESADKWLLEIESLFSMIQAFSISLKNRA